MAGAKNAKSRKQRPDWRLARGIWELLQDQGVLLQILKEADPARRWEQSGRTIRTKCPYHEDSNPSFHVNAAKGLCKCFGCGHWSVDFAQLIAKLRDCSYESALIFLSERLPLNDLYGKSLDKLSQNHSLEEMKKAASMAFDRVVEEFLRDRPQKLDYLKAGAVYLEKGRGVPVSMVSNLPVSLFPKPEHAKQYIPEEYHEEYDKYFKQVNTASHWGSPVFTYNDTPCTISRFKLRNKAKDFRYVTSREDVDALSPPRARALFEKTYTMVEDPIERPMGFFGLHHYSRIIGENNTSVTITEGEFDALSVMVGQIRNGSMSDFPILATGGMGSLKFDLLKEYWVRTLYAIPDTPGEKRGDQLAYNWLIADKKQNEALVDDSIMFKVFLWPQELLRDSGDLDDAVQRHGYDFVKRYIWGEKDSYYLNRLDWVTRKCSDEVDALMAAHEKDKAEKGKIEDGDARAVAIQNVDSDYNRNVRKAVADWIAALPDRIDRQIFTNTFSAKLGIDLTTLNEVFIALNNVEETAGAAKAVYDALGAIISFPYFTSKNGRPIYTVYSKVEEEMREAPFSQDYAIEHAISAFVANDMTEWMKALLRNAATTTPAEHELEKYPSATARRNEEQKRCMTVLRQMITTNLHTIKNRDDMEKVGQGIHYRDLTGNTKAVYFVNGMKVFKGVIAPESGSPIEWSRIHDIKDGNYWFECAKNMEWSSTVRDVDDLNSGMKVDIAGVFKQISSVLDGWEFQDHEVMRSYIAAWIMSLPIQLAIDRVTVTCITGESTSGKTSFLQGLLGGSKSANSRIPSILEPAKVVTDATEAYLAQTFDRTSMFVGVDEAETDDDADHNKRVKNLIRMLYSVSTGGGDIGRGSPNHTGSIEMQYKCPTLLAAIHLPTDEVFLTRTTILYTKKHYKWKDIGDYINQTLGSSHALNELRRAITTGLLHRLNEVMERTNALLLRLQKEETKTQTTDRFRESIAVALALYEMSGTEDDPHDPVELYHAVVKANKERLETILEADMKHPILNAVLYAKCIPLYSTSEGRLETVSPRDILIQGTKDAATTLNGAKCGVYWLHSRDWLVLYWRQIRANVLGSNPVYRDMSEGALRESISKNKFLVSDISESEHRLITGQLGIIDAKTSAAYSVVSIRYLIDDDNRPRPAEDGPKEVAPSEDEVPISAYETDF